MEKTLNEGNYPDCTFFTRKEILRVYERYKELSPDTVPRVMSELVSGTYKIPHNIIENMPEFKENPFRQRVCEVFTAEDGQEEMCFDDFLDMFSVFSESAPRDLKAIYAFKIYDFDGDDFLDKNDLIRTINCLTRNELSNDEVDFICEKVFVEADLDDDQMLSFSEFEYVLSGAPDFLSTFHIRI